MNTSVIYLLAAFTGILMLLAKPLGHFIALLVAGSPGKPVARLEQWVGGLTGIRDNEMNWRQYLSALLLINLSGLVVLFLILMTQGYLPLNPEHFPGMSWHLALNTAVSFVTNTDWQAYAGETTLSYFSQMAGLTVQNFLSAATGIAVAFALIRAFSRRETHMLGNAWYDLLRITLYLLLPLAFLLAIFFIWQGAIQNFSACQPITTLQGLHQCLPMGPVASQEAIKMLGTNGGGFFNANSAHPFENPTALSNFVQMLAIFLIPAALCFAFGKSVNDHRQGHSLLWAMSLVFIFCALLVIHAEWQGNPDLLTRGALSAANMEGKESRFGITVSALFTVITTAASCGAVNAMPDSFTALGGMIPLWLMQIGEVIFGGVGSGFYGMILFVLLAVFIAGLMIGRTPEYLGKKITAREMKLIALAILVSPALVLAGTALVLLTGEGQSAILNPGAHGFTEILYALSSAANNNGSAFSGLNATTPFWNLLLAFCMLAGRFAVIVPVLAIAGSMVVRKSQPAGPGTLSSCGPLFIGLLIGSVMLIGALTFVPALALGPVADYLSSH